MELELEAPASLLLGLSPQGDSLSALSLTVQYPPVQLAARPAPALEVSGACAPVGYAAVERLSRALPGLGIEVEIELATPRQMGLASEPMLQLSVARALAELHQLPADSVSLARQLGFGPELAPEVWGFTQGGLLLTDAAAGLDHPPLRRCALTHREDEAWVVVLYLPRPDPDGPDALEAERHAALWAAAGHLDPGTCRRALADLWPAVEGDDFPAFTRGVQALHEANCAALRAAGCLPVLPPLAQAVLDLMRAEGLTACGACLTGLGLYGLIQGARPSIGLRQKIAALVGFESGTVMATIADNAGCRVKTH
jgi:predicted sugar kinase